MKKRIMAMLALIMMLNNPKALSDDIFLPQGEYSKGNIYFGTEEEIESIKESTGPDDVLIIDERDFKKNPNVKIINSYRITDPQDILDIVAFLYQYEIDHPTEWERSELGMIREWLLHNHLYSFGIRPGSTKDVDFDNKDEHYYVRTRK